MKYKVKAGAEHHWYKSGKYCTKRRGLPAGSHWIKAEEDKIPRKPYVPTGRPKGRPKKAEEDKVKRVYVPTGRPRGRPKVKETKPPSGRPRGRPKKTENLIEEEDKKDDKEIDRGSNSGNPSKG